MRQKHRYLFLFLAYLFFNLSAEARLPKAEEFPETRKSLDSSRVPFLPPTPAYCRQEMFDQYVRNAFFRVVGSCGALEKLWKEAHSLLEQTVSTNLILLDMGSSFDTEQADSCQTQERLQKIHMTRNNLKSVQDRALKEGDRIMKICEKDLEEYKNRLRTIENNCSSAITPMLPLNKKEAEATIKQGNQFLKDHDKSERTFLKRIADLNQQLKEQEQAAISCKSSLESVPGGPGGFATSLQTSVSTSVGTSTNTSVNPNGAAGGNRGSTFTNTSTRTRTQDSTGKGSSSNTTTIYKTN